MALGAVSRFRQIRAGSGLAFGLMAVIRRFQHYAFGRWTWGNGNHRAMARVRAWAWEGRKSLAVGVVCGVPCGAQGAVQSAATHVPCPSVRIRAAVVETSSPVTLSRG